MDARAYAEALSELSGREGADAASLVRNLRDSLSKTGRLKLLPHILRELRKKEAGNRSTAPIVEAASEGETERALDEAAKAGIEAKTAIVNPSLIKGWRARAGGRLIDASAKRNLIELYRNITG